MKIYILPISDVKEWCNTHQIGEDYVLYVNDIMSENEVKDILTNTPAKYDKVAGEYTPTLFQGEFNFALEDKEISSAKYFIKIFPD